MTETTAPNSPALVVVDVQRDVMATCIRAPETIAAVGTLVDRARERGVPVIWVRHNDESGLAPGTPVWEIVPELTPANGEAIVDKRFFDAFAETDLVDRLGEAGADSLVLCGAQTDACIRSTFYGGLYRDYPVTLVTDAHTTEDMREWGAEFTPEQSIAVLNMQASETQLPRVGGAVTTTAEAFALTAPA